LFSGTKSTQDDSKNLGLLNSKWLRTVVALGQLHDAEVGQVPRQYATIFYNSRIQHHTNQHLVGNLIGA